MNLNGEVDAKTIEAAKAFGAALSKRPIEEQIAVGLISKNVLNGCSWEFTRNKPEIRRNMEAFKASKVVSAQEVTYDPKNGVFGWLIYMQMGKLLEILGAKNGGPLVEQDVKLAEAHRKEAGEMFIKKLQNGYSGRIGIFCTNDSPTITVSGKAYPAYALTLKETCAICSKMNYGIVVSGQPRDPGEVLKREDAVVKSLVVAPSSNALFIEIAPMGKKR